MFKEQIVLKYSFALPYFHQAYFQHIKHHLKSIVYTMLNIHLIIYKMLAFFQIKNILSHVLSFALFFYCNLLLFFEGQLPTSNTLSKGIKPSVCRGLFVNFILRLLCCVFGYWERSSQLSWHMIRVGCCSLRRVVVVVVVSI